MSRAGFTRLRQGFGGGFTLVELLVASVMLVLVMAGVAASLRTSLFAWERGTKSGERELPALVLGQMARELEQVGGDGSTRFFLVASDQQGEAYPADTLLMSTACLHTEGAVWRARREGEVQAWQPVPTRAEVEYALDQGEEPGLYRREVAPASPEPVLEEGEWELVCPQARGLDAAWWDGTQWTESWDTQSQDQPTLPAAARITLYLEDEQGRERTLETEVPLAPRFDGDATQE